MGALLRLCEVAGKPALRALHGGCLYAWKKGLAVRAALKDSNGSKGGRGRQRRIQCTIYTTISRAVSAPRAHVLRAPGFFGYASRPAQQRHQLVFLDDWLIVCVRKCAVFQSSCGAVGEAAGGRQSGA